jgi:predicted regulator of Ras-like GTPase activity (Roadblock/LC7/MglB family)
VARFLQFHRGAPIKTVQQMIISCLKRIFRRGTNSTAKNSTSSPFTKAPSSTPAQPSVGGADSRQNAFAVHFPVLELQQMLPDHLKSRVLSHSAAGLVVSVPVRRIVPQLAEGGITLTFGELRKAAPEAFSPDGDADAQAVCLPLAKVLPRIDPRFLQRRANQQKVEVPQDCPSPFESVKTANPPNAAPEPPAPEGSTVFVRKAAHPKGRPAPAASLPPPALKLPDPVPLSPAPLRPASPLPTPPAREEISNPVAQKPAQRPVSRPAPGRAKPGVTQSTLIFNVSDLSTTWPDALQEQLQDCIAADATLAVPRDAVAAGLKEGRIAFFWKTLRGWITPPPGSQAAAYDQLELELPLKDVSAAFLSKRAPAQAQKIDEDLDETLPDLFCPAQPPKLKLKERPALEDRPPIPMPRFGSNGSGKAVPETPMVPLTPLQGIVRGGSDTTTLKRTCTPDEVVARALDLSGVAGAIIALPDGLPVASRLPGDLNPEMIAAVLPQLFARLSEYTDELQLGKVDTLEFTSANVPWRLFRTRNLVFAAIAHKGERLPFSELTALVQEIQATRE